MNEVQRKGRNEERLTELFPTFRTRVSAVIAELEAQGLRPRIQDAWRSPQNQLIAFNSGHSELQFGFHNVTGPHGEKQALAVDLLDDDAPLAPSTRYLLMVARAARNHGLQTGILWGLPDKLRDAVDAAIDASDFNAPVKVGWDPTHIEPTGITVADAENGIRPA